MVNYKKVTIADAPLTPPTSKPNSKTNNKLKKSAIKGVLTHTKSLGDIDWVNDGLPDDEYIDMDPVYAPVAPDEPSHDSTTNGDNQGTGKSTDSPNNLQLVFYCLKGWQLF